MKRNKLLERQIKKYLPEGWDKIPGLFAFVDAVNHSYDANDRDRELGERAFRISEEEYIEVNNRLRSEVDNREKSLLSLKHAIQQMDENNPLREESDLTYLFEFLSKQIDKRKAMESSLSTTANRLSSLIMNIQDGILVENERREIVITNPVFCQMFDIPVPPEQLVGMDCSGSAEQSKHMFAEPEKFVERILKLVKDQQLCTDEELELVDGRIFQRDYIPVFIDNKYKGHLWKYRDITATTKALKALEKSEQRYKQLSEEMRQLSLVASVNKNGIVFTKPSGEIFWANEGFTHLTEYKLNEVLGKTPIEVFAGAETDRRMLSRMVDLFVDGMPFDVELLFYRKDQSVFWGRTTGQPVFDDKGNLTQYFSMIEDITEEREREQNIKRLSLVASSNSKGIMTFNEKEEVEWINSSYEAITGFSLEDLKGKNPMPFVIGPETDLATAERMHLQALNHQGFSEDFLHYRKDGSTFWAHADMEFVLDENGNVLQQFVVVLDISQRKEAEEKLRQSELRWKFALEGASHGVFEFKLGTNEIYLSPQFKKMLGYADHELPNSLKSWYAHLSQPYHKRFKEISSSFLKKEIAEYDIECSFLHKTGKEIWALVRGISISYDKEGVTDRVVGTVTDITERKQSEQILQIREEKYRNIIANMNLGLLEVDNAETIQYANQRFCEMSGFDLDELIGNKASRLFVRGENHELLETKNELRKKGSSDAYEIVVKNKRGEIKWWLISGAPRFNDSGELVGSIGIHLDITDQKNLEIALYAAREEAEQSAMAKEVFLANMSHEIRTPMNAILGMSRQLQKTVLNEQQHLFLETINTAAEHLLVIINDILDISKIEAGKMIIEQINFCPNDVLGHLVNVMQHRADEKGLLLQTYYDPKISSGLIGDPYRLNQVLLNLLSNAIKFTEKGTIKISFHLADESETSQTLVMSVEDTGIGMDESYLNTLFQKFTQEDKSIARKFGGTGLGMAISKQLVELMNGSIDVRSVKGKGTEVRLRIPFDFGEELAEIEEVQTDYDTRALAGKKILLVEDNEMNRLVAVAVLEPYVVEVTEVENGKEAVEILAQQTFDLVLMDMQMPEMNGLEATAYIRQEMKLDIPIIALTANAIKGESENCLKAGMNAYVSKPFEERDLVQTMLECLVNSGHTANLKPKENKSKMNEAPLYNLDKLKNISRGNQVFVEKMVKMFIDQVPVSVREMKQALNESAFEKLGAIAHKIKPAIDNMDITDAKQLVRELEQLRVSAAGQASAPEKLIQLGDIIENVKNGLLTEFMFN